MSKLTCAGGCGKVRDLEVSQKSAKDVGYTVSPRFWVCEDCKAREIPPGAVSSQVRPLPQAVDPGIPFTFSPRQDPAVAKQKAAQPAETAREAAGEETPEKKAEGAPT